MLGTGPFLLIRQFKPFKDALTGGKRAIRAIGTHAGAVAKDAASPHG